MLDANKYIDRLRVIVKSSYEVEKYIDKAYFLLYRLEDLIRDYDRDFDKAMQEMKEEEEGVRRGRETAEYLKKLNKKKGIK